MAEAALVNVADFFKIFKVILKVVLILITVNAGNFCTLLINTNINLFFFSLFFCVTLWILP